MRIGIDARSLQEPFGGGVTEYTRNLLKNIFAIDQRNEYVLFLNSVKTKLADLLQFKQSNIKIVAKSVPNKFLNSSFTLFKRPYLDELLGGVDVLFLPNINFVAFSPKVKTVLTIHDLSFELMPEFYSLKGRIWHQVIRPKRMIKQVDRIIAVSHSTASDLQKYYQVPEEKITVIHSGIEHQLCAQVDENSISQIRRKYSLPKKYILTLGAGDPRKNSISLIEAYQQLENRISDMPHLVLVGVDKIKNDSDKIHSLPYLSSEEKRVLLARATCLIYPSYYEGFGFPPLEAMAAGTPVIASNNSSLPEVVGEAGILINPDDTAELVFALKQVLLDNKLRENLIHRGKQKAQEFSWQQSAKKTIEVLASSNL